MYWQVTPRRAPKSQTLYLQIKDEGNISYIIVLSIMSTPAVFDTSMALRSSFYFLSDVPVPSRPVPAVLRPILSQHLSGWSQDL